MEQRFMTYEQLGVALNVSKRTLYRMVKEGMPHSYVGKCRRFNIDNVIHWIENKK